MGLFRELRTKLGLRRKKAADRSYISAAYYQREHEKSNKYQDNNWLLGEEDRMLACGPKTIVEIGFGNGRFLRQVADKIDSGMGLDWAISPLSGGLPSNIEIRRSDVVNDPIPSADLICSADVLEHFNPNDIDSVVAKLHSAGKFNFHVIACYDDGHSHLTILPPQKWLEKFRAQSDHYELVDIRQRRNLKENLVCVIANY